MHLKIAGILVPLLLGFWIPVIHAADQRVESPESPAALRLSLNEAVALFLKQNFDLFITKYGIDHAKGEQITARLFPNPEFAVGGASAFTQGQTLRSTGLIMPSIQQLFEVAGKRGYRIESARYGVRSAEAQFEDAVRQLTFTVQDTYFRVQLAQKRQELAQENRDRFRRILAVNTIRFEKGFIAEVDLIRIRLQIVDFHAQVIQEIQEANRARAELRFLLGISPATPLVLTTELTFNRIDPDLPRLQALALEARPDIQARQMARSQRMAEQKLARAFRYPDITVGGSYGIQGPQGPDLQQQWGLSLGFPLPIFNRNQGGIVQAEVGVQAAEVELKKTLLQVANEVEVAYRNLVESRHLVEAYHEGVLEDARVTLGIVERAYVKGGFTILDLLDAARTARTIQQDYLDALYQYQRNVFLLESAVGQETVS